MSSTHWNDGGPSITTATYSLLLCRVYVFNSWNYLKDFILKPYLPLKGKTNPKNVHYCHYLVKSVIAHTNCFHITVSLITYCVSLKQNIMQVLLIHWFLCSIHLCCQKQWVFSHIEKLNKWSQKELEVTEYSYIGAKQRYFHHVCEHSYSCIFKGIVWRFGKYAYWFLISVKYEATARRLLA